MIRVWRRFGAGLCARAFTKFIARLIENRFAADTSSDELWLLHSEGEPNGEFQWDFGGPNWLTEWLLFQERERFWSAAVLFCFTRLVAAMRAMPADQTGFAATGGIATGAFFLKWCEVEVGDYRVP